MERQGFIDWLKAVGMFAIVVGHIVGSPYDLFNLVSQPVYTKQLGVCFFIFIMGWSLANESRTSFQVVFNRVFPIYFYGLVFAILTSSVLIFTINDLNESNYIPFVLGINVFFNHFPANPTTWYIGTYLHILLFWFFFVRGYKITKKHLVLAILTECTIRAFLLHLNKDFVAYMLLHNWLTVFILGGFLCQKTDTEWNIKTTLLVLIWAVIVAVWASPLNSLFTSRAFPFRELVMNESWSPVLRSVLISCIYTINTYVFFEIFRRLPHSKVISFFARNSLITFIIHMPLIYGLDEKVYSYFDNEWAEKLSLILIIFIGSALISEIIQKFVKVDQYKVSMWNYLSKLIPQITRPKDSVDKK